MFYLNHILNHLYRFRVFSTLAGKEHQEHHIFQEIQEFTEERLIDKLFSDLFPTALSCLMSFLMYLDVMLHHVATFYLSTT